MLKITSLSFLLFVFISCVVSEEKYSGKYDYVNVDEILANQRLKDQYYDCFMDLGPCVTADQKFFRQFIPDAFKTQCRRCTEKQKYMFDRVAEDYSAHNPKKWDAVIQKYVIDPSGLNNDKKSK